MYNLTAFRNKVRELCRRSAPYDDERRASLTDLADAIGLSRGELSYRLNGTNKAKLTDQDARAIVRALTEWGAINTRAEVVEMLALVNCPPPSAADWEAPPFDQLIASPLPAPAILPSPAVSPAPASANVRLAKVEQRRDIIRPPSHQPESSRLAVGRTRELAALRAALNKHTCVAITGGGGIGKSTFVAMYGEGAGYSTVCWRNLHHNPNFADFTEAALSSLGLYFDPSAMPRPQDQANYIATLLRGNSDIRQLLVLNNFESIIGPDGVEAGWQELLELAIAGLGNSRVLITTREMPYTRQGREPHRFALAGMSVADGVALLEALEVQAAPDQLEQAVKLAGGHPLALVFLADLSHNQGYAVADLLKETAWSERIAERFLDRIYRQLTPSAQAALTYFSVFDAPVRAATMAGMLAHLPTPATPLPPTEREVGREASWGEARVRSLGNELAGRNLLDSRGGYYQLHPIVREYAHSRLTDRPAYHRAAAAYYQSLYTHDPDTNPPQQLADVQPLLYAFDHFCTADDYNAAYDIFIAGRWRMSGDRFVHLSLLLNRWGEYSRTFAICKRLTEAPTGLLDGEKRSVAFNNLGVACRNLGQYQEALIYYQRGLALVGEQSDIRLRLDLLSNVAVAYEWLKDYDQAISYNQQVLALAEPIGYLHPQGTVWTSLGHIYAKRGDYIQALAYHQRGLTLAQQTNDEKGIVTDLLNLAETYHHLGQIEAAMQHYQRGLVLAEQLGYLDGQATIWHKGARLLLDQGRQRDALACLLKALQMREQIGNQEDIEQTRDIIATIRTALPAAEWRKLFAEAGQLAADSNWRPWAST